MPQLIITEQGTNDRRVVPCDRAEISVGATSDNTLVLAGPDVSRRHAIISHSGDDFFLMDVGSTTGTRLSGTAIQRGERYVLRSDDLITIGQYHIQFSRADVLEQSFNEITDSDIMEVKLLKKVLKALDQDTVPNLEVMNGPLTGRKFHFSDDLPEFLVGRDPACHLAVEEYSVSRKHAHLRRSEGQIVVEDLDSKNGTFVNQRRVTALVIHDGDRIAFGTIVTMFRNPREINVEAVSQHVREHRKTRDDLDAATQVGTAPTAPDETPSATTSTENISVDETPSRPAEPAEQAYPVPRARRRLLDNLSPTEMGMLWSGLIVLVVVVVLLVKLILT